MSVCEKKGHIFDERFDEEVISISDSFKETHVRRTYICDVCRRCGKIINRPKK